MKNIILFLSVIVVLTFFNNDGATSLVHGTGNKLYTNAQITLADSVGDFSGTQGLNNWFYGYYDAPPDSNTFQQIPDFTINALWLYAYTPRKDVWWFKDRSRWITITNKEMIPNGNLTSGVSVPGEKWVVRRWVSTVSGTVALSGEVFKFDPSCGNGSTAHVFVDGIERWSQFTAANDTIGVQYNLSVAVNMESKVDFIISPGTSDYCDTVNFTAKITKTNNSVFLPLVVSSVNSNISTALLAPVASGQTVKIIHGYNDPLPSENCVIGASLDHCNNQRYGLDLAPSNQSLLEILAPISGKIAWISGDCLGVRTLDDYNLTICHFSRFQKAVNDQVSIGTVLGIRKTSWIHLSIDDRYRSSSKPPIPFNKAHTIEGVSFDPPTDESTQRNVHIDEIITSTNQAK